MKSKEFKEYIKDNILIFDGAMGTQLQNKGLKIGEVPEVLNITQANIIEEIHREYIDAGAKVITSNTFGANELKLQGTEYSVEEIIDSAVSNAKKAIEGRNIFIALDIGPIGELIEPMGDLTFDRAYHIYKRQILQGVKSGVDLILIETMTDLYEAKAAVLAAKENCDLPVIVTMTFEKDHRTFTGCLPGSMAISLDGLGVDALGINCSLGPKEISQIVKELVKWTDSPILVQANAGLPSINEGQTHYGVGPEEFAEESYKLIKSGVSLMGGCCGTTPEYIRKIKEKISGLKKVDREKVSFSALCTPTNIVTIDGVRVIGERINPTGKKLLKEALKTNNMEYILKQGISQIEAGAHILDVNVGIREINQKEMIVKLIKELQKISNVPLQIDSSDPEVIEAGLRYYNGKAMVNSVNGEEKLMDQILPLVKKYGGAVVGLTLDEKGIPDNAFDRYKIAEKIVKKAEGYGIKKEDIYIDTLTLTCSAQQEEVVETIKALTLVKEKLGVKTVLGVSNISFGMPNRPIINETFLAIALAAGLDLPIINPNDTPMMDKIYAFNVLYNYDKGSRGFIKRYGDSKSVSTSKKEKTVDEYNLKELVIKGLKEDAALATGELLKSKEELQIVNEFLIPALDQVGNDFEKGIIFLPQLIQSAETVKSSFDILKGSLKNKESVGISKGKIILATVKGDIHDIGKNIVKIILENYNYEIIDLGKDVPAEKIVEEARKQKEHVIVGLSALMTTTMKSMEETIEELRKNKIDCTIIVGGAVLTQQYAENMGADYYGKDAKDAVEIAKKIFK